MNIINEIEEINRRDRERQVLVDDRYWEPLANGLKKPWLVWDGKKWVNKLSALYEEDK